MRLLSKLVLAAVAVAASPSPVPRSRSRSSSGRTSTRRREPYHKRVGVGGRRDQEAHQRQVRHRGVPGLDARQGNRHQPGPDARHRRHDHHRPVVRGAQLPARSASPTTRSSSATPITCSKYVEERRLQGDGRGVPQEDRHPDHRATPTTARARPRRNKPFTDCAGMKGLKIRVPDVPAYMATPKALRRQSDADRLRRGLPRAAERHRRRAGEPAADDRGEEVLRSAEGHHADRPHRRRRCTTQVAPHVWNKLTDDEKKIFTEVTQRSRATARGREIKKREARAGRRVQEEGHADRQRRSTRRFRDAVLKNAKPVESMGFTQAGLRQDRRDQVTQRQATPPLRRRRRRMTTDA